MDFTVFPLLSSIAIISVVCWRMMCHHFYIAIIVITHARASQLKTSAWILHNSLQNFKTRFQDDEVFGCGFGCCSYGPNRCDFYFACLISYNFNF